MAALIAVFALLFLVRAALAWRYANAAEPPPTAPAAVAILQPILSGDPALPATLARNARALPHCRFYWLVDDDDPAGQAAAAAAATPNVRILNGPGPIDGENPKIGKLHRALATVEEPITVALDDDTHMDAAGLARLCAALDGAGLVTGLPVFISKTTIYERFIGGFVNGNALLTYLPAAALNAQHTINGMIYAVRTAELRALGGFDAIRTELTDDYAMARLYESNGRKIRQTAVCAEVGITITDAAHCGRVLRRWFIFANRYLRHNLSPATILLTALPTMLPLAGWLAGGGWPWLACLTAKAIGNRVLLWRIAGHRSGPLNILFEVAADTVSPLIYLSALIRPNRVRWRNRRIAMEGDRIHYR